jgi:hypothetical protein
MAELEAGQLRKTWLADKTAWQATADLLASKSPTTMAAATENRLPYMKPNPFCCLLSALCLVTTAAAAADWPRVMLASPGEVEIAGPAGPAGAWPRDPG